MWVNRIRRMEITSHAVRRMMERCCNPEEVISFLRRSNKLILLKNHQGYEIIIPFKGRLVGDFDGGTFIVKSFLLPPRFGKDYYVNGRKSRDGCMVKVLTVSYPRGRNYYQMNTIKQKGA